MLAWWQHLHDGLEMGTMMILSGLDMALQLVPCDMRFDNCMEGTRHGITLMLA